MSSPIYLGPKKKSSPIYLGPQILLCNIINWVSRIEEQRKTIKNNEEKNPKLLFVHVHVDAMLACRLCLIHIIPKQDLDIYI